MSVESQTASGVDTDGATLTAQVTATRGSQIVNPTSVGFRFGTISNALNSTQTATPDQNGNFTATLSGLAHSTTYFWVAYAIVEDTEYTSAQDQFTTTTPTPVVDETWLELPAAMDGTDYEGATVWTVKDGSTRNYTIAYDTSEYATYWVAYNLTSSHMGNLERPTKWTYDESTGAPATSKQVNVDNTYATYNNGDGHARGHLIPNASRNGDEEMQAQTFYYTNSVPQWQNGFNSGMWSALEGALQTIGKSEEIFIVTGTAFKKVGESKTISYTSTPSDSGKSVPIPNYFYKVVLKVNKSGSTVTDAKAIGFWFENKSYPNSEYSSSSYTVSVNQIEEWTGLNFFVNLSDTVEESAESNESWSTFQNF